LKTLKLALTSFLEEPFIPPEAANVWTDCFARAFELVKRDSESLNILNDTVLVRNLLASCIGRDWYQDLISASSDIRSAVRAAARG
jgi:hypothetical protein